MGHRIRLPVECTRLGMRATVPQYLVTYRGHGKRHGPGSGGSDGIIRRRRSARRIRHGFFGGRRGDGSHLPDAFLRREGHGDGDMKWYTAEKMSDMKKNVSIVCCK